MTYHWTILVPKSPTRAHKLHANDFVPGTWTYVSEEQTMTRVVGEIPPPIAVVKLGESSPLLGGGRSSPADGLGLQT